MAVPASASDAGDMDAHQALAGLRYGISVTDLDGNVLIAHRSEERFMPASNAKLFVTAAALAAAAELSAVERGLQVMSVRGSSGLPSLTLVGRGDPTVGFGPGCEMPCLETLAEAVADSGITEIEDIVGDDRWFADERRPLGWSWDDLKFGYATSISSIAVNDNILPLRVRPSESPGAQVQTAWLDAGDGYFTLQNQAKTSASSGELALRLERREGERAARLYGEMPSGSRSMTLDLGVDDPAHLAVWYFEQALKAEGVTVQGELRSRHRALQYTDETIKADLDDPDSPKTCRVSPPVKSDGVVIASLPATPIRDIVNTINRDSQNLYAEVLLRQLGWIEGTASSFCGLLHIERFLNDVGVPRSSYDFADASGLSSYNRVTPATITALLRYAAAQDWGDAYRESLPVGGAPIGTLKYRFRGTALENNVFAKTGTLNHVDALSGYLVAQSGKVLVFSIIVNDRPLESLSAMERIESLLLQIAEQH
ncbi:D-alanyl-D-alanine carboxypeptidase/D-alanyl-D-alanine-endopeptidase [Parvularcula bermudensis]|nr:D-alanyl-D-alanine carboxypeptidase/D-alanyl-D-alanine-endopeptidase [Parvularcula bermudensis]